MNETQIAARLSEHAEVAADPGLAQLGAAAFAYAAILLDDDENLTRLGNPTGDARKKLQARIEELLAGADLGGDEDFDLPDDEDFEEPDFSGGLE